MAHGDPFVYVYNNQDGHYYAPLVEGEVTWNTRLSGSAGTLELNIVKDDVIDFRNGNTVVLKINGMSGERVFKGFVFSKARNKEPVIAVTVYDQLRYLKNKTTLKYSDLTASGLFELCIKDTGLLMGDVDSSASVLPARVEENKEYFEIINRGIEREKAASGEIFVMYDDGGEVCFKNIKHMAVLDYVYDAGRIEDFDYTTSIDNGTYNRIRVDHINDETGVAKPLIREDEARIEDWGVLQYYAKSNEPLEVVEQKMETLLPLLSREIRTLEIKGALGDMRVRAGSIIPVSLNLGDLELVSAMLVTDCTHTIAAGHHSMDLVVENKTFMPAIEAGNVFKYENKTKEGGSGSAGGGVPEDSVEGQIWNILRGLGYSKEATAVVISHAFYESGFKTGAVESGNTGEGRGMFQWGVNARWKDFLAWAGSQGLDPYAVKTQVLFVDHEMKAKPSLMAGVGGYESFKSNSSIDDANRQFYHGYERPKWNPANYENRRQTAHEYYGKYAALETQYREAEDGGSGLATGYMKWPVPGWNGISSHFGYRRDPFTGAGQNHLGTDIPASRDAPVVAADGGVVEQATHHWSYGNYVLVNHGGGLKTRYAHLNYIGVRVGQSVSRGQTLGGVGTTGSSTGNHLHFEVIVNGTHMNPLTYVNQGHV